MGKDVRSILSPVFVALVVLTLFATLNTGAREKSNYEEYQAQAFGQGAQLGQTFSVTVTIYEYSPQEDQQILLKSFTAGGMNGLVNALSKMKAKGHIEITGTLGYDVSYIRSFPTADGRKIRLVTNRPITFGEAWSDSNSMNYNLSALELDISNVKGKSSGTLLPACQFKLDKENEIEIVNFQNPWRLTDVLQRK
ncbi:MAG TPA: hypothetical protein VJX29_13045 [Candidatus Acidoferrales bacterium]|nr:hypothetical protein [Candidatus Acidoferrales bacterium]